MQKREKTSRTLKGLGVSSGIGRGTAAILLSDHHLAVPRREITVGEIGGELERFYAALKIAEAELSALRDAVEKSIGRQEADIFGAQMMMLRDPILIKDVLNSVSHEKLNIEAALTDVIARAAKVLAELKDPYIQERAADVRDIGRRVLTVLMREHAGETFSVPEGSIVVATELLPSVTAHMQLRGVRALLTELGSKTSHAAILARSMGLPYVVGIAGAVSAVQDGDELIVDGKTGEVFINPAPEISRRLETIEAKLEERKEELQEFASLPSVTLDHTQIRLCANLAKLEEAENIQDCGADGVGLCRTEFLFMARERFPTEEEQFDFYRAMAKKFSPARVVIRVLDLGADKVLPYFPLPDGPAVGMGLRGTRLLLRYPDILRTQLKAVLRASAFGAVEVLFPMVIDEQEMAECRRAVRETQEALLREGRMFRKDMPIGAMIEVPAAAILAGGIARQADFLSVGTNDLIQYLLTADRNSQEMAPYYDSLHPSLLWTLRHLVSEAKNAGKDLSVCGELAAEPRCTGLLLGLGIRSLSVVPGRLLEVRRAVRATDIAEAEGLARRCLDMGNTAEVRAALKQFAACGAPTRG